ncbi:T9SS type A sorting domain-containing protein [Rufibacter sp. LB8]|uniref:T9SS type A sorting domain-containing protein n=1 Tax=Rufibacter sp. LB8 TaxID=2777781 RepID=UPI00178C3C53|nr:T9SS type A sorting domain-containing protein [Rufibacter sp. LB8]
MKIFTRVFLGILSLGLVFGSQAASFGVAPGVVPVSVRANEPTKGDTVLINWRTGAGLTITDFGISTALQLPSYNPNAKKYTPFVRLQKKSSVFSKPSIRKNDGLYASTVRVTNSQGAKEVRVTPSISASPNPSRGMTRIALTALGDDQYHVRISNAIGKIYKVIAVPQASEAIMVDLSPLPPGIYFYSLLVNEKMVETKRLILQQQ